MAATAAGTIGWGCESNQGAVKLADCGRRVRAPMGAFEAAIALRFLRLFAAKVPWLEIQTNRRFRRYRRSCLLPAKLAPGGTRCPQRVVSRTSSPLKKPEGDTSIRTPSQSASVAAKTAAAARSSCPSSRPWRGRSHAWPRVSENDASIKRVSSSPPRWQARSRRRKRGLATDLLSHILQADESEPDCSRQDRSEKTSSPGRA